MVGHPVVPIPYEAVEHALEATRTRPGDPGAWFELGLAVGDLRRAAGSVTPPDDWPDRLPSLCEGARRALVAHLSRTTGAAARSTDPMYWGALVHELAQQGLVDETVGAFLKERATYNLSCGNPLASSWWAAWQLWKTRRAIDAYRRCLDLGARQHEAVNNLAVELHEQTWTSAEVAGMQVDAEGTVPRRENELHDSEKTRARRAAARVEAGQLLDEALELSRGLPAVRHNRAIVRHEAGRHREAVPDYEEALRASPDSSSLLNDLGVALWRIGERDRAVEAFTRAQGGRPGGPQAAHNLTAIHLLEGRPLQAIETARATLASLEDGKLWEILGVALLETRNIKECKLAYGRAQALMGKSRSLSTPLRGHDGAFLPEVVGLRRCGGLTRLGPDRAVRSI